MFAPTLFNAANFNLYMLLKIDSLLGNQAFPKADTSSQQNYCNEYLHSLNLARVAGPIKSNVSIPGPLEQLSTPQIVALDAGDKGNPIVARQIEINTGSSSSSSSSTHTTILFPRDGDYTVLAIWALTEFDFARKLLHEFMAAPQATNGADNDEKTSAELNKKLASEARSASLPLFHAMVAAGQAKKIATILIDPNPKKDASSDQETGKKKAKKTKGAADASIAQDNIQVINWLNYLNSQGCNILATACEIENKDLAIAQAKIVQKLCPALLAQHWPVDHEQVASVRVGPIYYAHANPALIAQLIKHKIDKDISILPSDLFAYTDNKDQADSGVSTALLADKLSLEELRKLYINIGNQGGLFATQIQIGDKQRDIRHVLRDMTTAWIASEVRTAKELTDLDELLFTSYRLYNPSAQKQGPDAKQEDAAPTVNLDFILKCRTSGVAASFINSAFSAVSSTTRWLRPTTSHYNMPQASASFDAIVRAIDAKILAQPQASEVSGSRFRSVFQAEFFPTQLPAATASLSAAT